MTPNTPINELLIDTVQMPKPFSTAEEFEKETVRHIETTLARSLYNCDETAAYGGTALAFRDRLILDWNKTQQTQTFADQKRVYYLSLEFLMGRTLDNAMLNVGQKDVAASKSGTNCKRAWSYLTVRRGSCRSRIPHGGHCQSGARCCSW